MKLHIPKTYYVKFQDRGGTPLGFAVPYQEGEHKEAKSFSSTRATMEQWSTSEEGFVLDNDLAAGYSIGDVISRWRTSNKVWRIMDPRGFELEVPSHNLASLLATCCIDKGVIQERCLWARGDDGQNYLISESSPEYEEALSYTERRLTRVSLRDLNRGDRVLLKDGTEAIYYGGFYGFDEVEMKDQDRFAYDWAKRRYLYEPVLDSDGEEVEERRLKETTTLHVSGRLEEADPALTDEEALDIVRELLKGQYDRWNASGPDHYALVKNTWDQLTMILEPLDLTEVFGEEFSGLPEEPDTWVMHDTREDTWWHSKVARQSWSRSSTEFLRIRSPQNMDHSRFEYIKTLDKSRYGRHPYSTHIKYPVNWREVVQNSRGLEFYRVTFKGRKGTVRRCA